MEDREDNETFVLMIELEYELHAIHGGIHCSEALLRRSEALASQRRAILCFALQRVTARSTSPFETQTMVKLVGTIPSKLYRCLNSAESEEE